MEFAEAGGGQPLGGHAGLDQQLDHGNRPRDRQFPIGLVAGPVANALPVRVAVHAQHPVEIFGDPARDVGELVEIATLGLRNSRINQVLIEESILGWQELEYEVMRDEADNATIVCTMENIDPMGVHTGESVVVAPLQSFSDADHQILRDHALRLIRALNIKGGCNVQFAFNQATGEVRVIEVNPRVSRSSALASKTTGYPIARMAAKIAVGYTLDELPNPITGEGTTAAFEPTLDYCVVKIPRWPFDKFRTADRTLGTSMKSTGEVMAIGRCFEEAFLKAWASLEQGVAHPRPLTRADEGVRHPAPETPTP